MSTERNETKEKYIREKVLAIYENIKAQQETGKSQNKIQSVTYYKDLVLIQPGENDGLAESDIYAIKMIDENQRELLELYNENMKIATVDENGKISFTQEYLDELANQDKDPDIPSRKNIAEKNNGQTEFKAPEELEEVDRGFSKEEMESLEKQESENIKNNKQSINSEQEIDAEFIGQKEGLKEKNINASVKIDPKEQVTDKETFEDIAGIAGKYTEVYAVYSNGRSQIYGVNNQGEAEIIPELRQRAVQSAGRDVPLMDYTGNDIEKQTVRSIFDTSDTRKSLALNVETNGRLKVYYMLRNPEQPNEYLGAPISTDMQTRALGEEKRFIGTEMQNRSDKVQAIEKANHQLEESNITNKSLIDNDKNNDKITIDPNEEIIMPDGKTTTIAKQASNFEKYGITLDKYINMLEDSEEKCIPEKILTTNTQLEKERDSQKETDEEHEMPTEHEFPTEHKFSGENDNY